MKKELSLRVIGLDINENELRQAPKDSYDREIAADITECKGQGDADLVICKALIETCSRHSEGNYCSLQNH